ncbi:MAG: argininosuccinate synthase [Bacteroidota bacterium]
MKPTRIVVAYSGGLDTSVMVRWLIERWNAEVITVTGDLGQKKELNGVEEKALKTGAIKAYIIDARKEFVEGYVFPALKASALYEGVYPMATSLGRPLLAKLLVDTARKENATLVAHGATGKGNDQVRFEVSVAALAPELNAIAPLREWEFKSREEEIAYAKQHNIPVTATVANPYSIDENLWGTSIECGVLEDPAAEAPEDAYQLTVSPLDAPNKPEYVEIAFAEGVPVGLNGSAMDPVALIEKLNEIGGAHGVGRLDLIENRLVGIKSREVYETPAASILHFAHTELERLTLDRSVFHMKYRLAGEYATLVYDGLWFSPLRKAMAAFVDETQKPVTGDVKVKLLKGTVSISGRSSVHSLYNEKLATYTEEDTFDHNASSGFIKIFGLPVKTYHQVQRDAADASGTPPKAKEAEAVS